MEVRGKSGPVAGEVKTGSPLGVTPKITQKLN
jgi:hypothetical protein